ncbi:anti-sigma-I factor RsgI family protein [Metaplanococcus flavidus]|uniref:RsgI N-terminal anti-sigma domain-containing protein n=1 Tax=Metaplanococcus flavidus TaxID=569883 RepID=A0ABW3LA11_9BACL
MRMQKGLCVELNDKTSVFIGPNGEFVHGTPARETSVGEECYFYPKQISAAKRMKMIKPVWMSFAAASVVAILFLAVLLPKQEAYAYVQVQVNPGIELGIDENYDVVSIRELNEDGLKLISELDEWEDHSLDEILDKVIKLSMSETTDEIIITTIPDEKDAIADEAIVNAVMAISAKVLAGDVAVRLKDASRAQWRNSIEEKVPAGQLVTDSKSLPNKKTEQKDNERLKIKEEQTDVEQQKEKQVKPADYLKDEDQKTPADKEKVTPPGQKKRQDKPAAEKGKTAPPGQDKRNEVPGQNKKNNNAESKDEKGKETGPGQQKKNEDSGEVKGNGNGSSVKVKDKSHPDAKEKGKGEAKPSKGKDHPGNKVKPRENQSDKSNGHDENKKNIEKNGKSNKGKKE